MNNAHTVDEVKEQLISSIRNICHYWANLPNKSDIDRCEGVAFSILNIIDGTSAGLPSMDLVLRPHPDDMQFNLDNGDNYYEDGMVVNSDCYLHDMLFGDDHG